MAAGLVELVQKPLLALQQPLHAIEIVRQPGIAEPRDALGQVAFKLLQVGPRGADDLAWRSRIGSDLLRHVRRRQPAAAGDASLVGILRPGQQP
jgi:hypothetical protein